MTTTFDADTSCDLQRAAVPVIDRLQIDLDGTDVAIVVSDDDARVIERRVPGAAMRSRLDAISLAPGHMWSVENVGPNAIGEAVARRRPVMVDGDEHFTEALASLTAAAAPIIDPRTGQLLGAVALVCVAEAANALLLPIARHAAHHVADRLLDGRAARERLLEATFLRARRRSRSALAVVGERTFIANAAALRLVDRASRARLWEQAERAIERGDDATEPFVGVNGSLVAARSEAIFEGDDVVGALVRFRVYGDAAESAPARRRGPFGWDSLTETEYSLAALIAEGLTNKQAAARLFMSRHTVDAHLRHIFRKLGINSRVDLARLVSTRLAAGEAA
jgi:DNA-binding CsgD family transcriptional regulator